MVETKEALKLTVEDDAENNPYVNDIDITLNTGEGFEASTATDLINGELLAAIISCNKEAKITIRFAEVPDIIVYQKEDPLPIFLFPPLSLLSRLFLLFLFLVLL